MDSVLQKSNIATIEKKGNIVYKTFHHEFPKHITKEWQKDYNDLSDINPYFIKILECNRTEKYISMPYIPSVCISENTFSNKILYQTLELIKDMMMFAEIRNGFIHTDLHCDNLLINSKLFRNNNQNLYFNKK